MDNVNRQRLEHMIGGPLSEHLERAFDRIEVQARAANGESHPRGWILAMCNEIAYLSGRIAQMEQKEDPAPPPNLENLVVKIKDVSHPAVFLGFSPKGWYRVRLEGEDRIRVIPPSKVNVDG